MNQTAVKYLIGLKLASAGHKNFAVIAARLGITRAYLSMIVNCQERPAKYQEALAELCGCKVKDLFAQFTNPDLIGPAGRAGARAVDRSRKQKESA